MENKQAKTKIDNTEAEAPEKSNALALLMAEKSNGEVVVFKKPTKRRQKNKKESGGEVDFSAFYELASMMDMSIEDALDKCCMFQVRNLMAKIGKVIVRYNISEFDFMKTLHNTNALSVSEVVFSPAYLPTCKKVIGRRPDINQNTGVIIDFPFGESSFKSKLLSVKESVDGGVDTVNVMMPSMLFARANQKELKKQIRKIASVRGAEIGLAVSAMDISDDELKTAMKFIERSKLSFITLCFGAVTESELKAKIGVITDLKPYKKVKVIANVDSTDAVKELIKLKVDTILTPYADAIGKELLARFKIKSVKLK